MSTSKGGTLSSSFLSSSTRSFGSKPSRVEADCPNLIKAGPSSSKAMRIRVYTLILSTSILRSKLALGPFHGNLAMASLKPYFANMLKIWELRCNFLVGLYIMDKDFR
ncbi:hypothetical protein D3C73_646700 [compost metagenome]